MTNPILFIFFKYTMARLFGRPKSRAENITKILNFATAKTVQSSKLDCKVIASQRAGVNISGGTGDVNISGNTTSQNITSKLTCTIDTSQQTKLTNDVKSTLSATAKAIATGIVAPRTQSIVKSQIDNIVNQESIQSAMGEFSSIMTQSAVQTITDRNGNINISNQNTEQNINSVADGLLQSKQLQDTIQKVANVIDTNASATSTGVKGGDMVMMLLLVLAIIVCAGIGYWLYRRRMMDSALK